MESITDKRVILLQEITTNYLLRLSSLRDSFIANYESLISNAKNSDDKLKDFLRMHLDEPNKQLIVGIGEILKMKELDRKNTMAQVSLKIIPESLFVSIISQYDDFIGKMIHFIYQSTPTLINEHQGTITYGELFQFSDINTLKDKLIEQKIESILRDSHDDQLNEISKLIKIRTLSKFEEYSDFVEMTQRRNLLVHANGIVSDQYIKKCKSAKLTNIAQKGDILLIDNDYFINAYYVFYCVGVMLSQTIARVIFDASLWSQIDAVLNNIIYDTIEKEEYHISIRLSEYATSLKNTHRSQIDSVYFVLNRAQSYKWNGNEEKCKQVLESFDFSAMTDEIMVAKYALEDNLEETIILMGKIGDSGKIMNVIAYSNWVIFKKMRGQEKFCQTYEKIFGQPINSTISIPQ